MASANSFNNRSFDPLTELGPGLTALLLLMVALFALPAVALGLLAHRFTRALPWRVSLLLWVLLAGVSGYLLSLCWQHGLNALFAKEMVAYVQAFSHVQFNLLKLPLAQLWPDTWPVWLRTLVGAPFMGLAQEVFAQKALHLDPAQAYLARERRRQRANARAAARTRRLRRLPPSVGMKKGSPMMVIGVPLDDEEQEEV
jgi:hypothetical protein